MGKHLSAAKEQGFKKVGFKRFMDQRLIDAISHPARAHVLATLNERTASPIEVADEIGVDVKYLNYHFEALEKAGCIELIKTEQRRGATKHYYRATETVFFGDDEWACPPAPLRTSFTASWLREIGAEAARALEAGTFEARSDRHFSWTPLNVDERGWREIKEALDEALERIVRTAARSRERLERDGTTPIPMIVAITGFETPGDRTEDVSSGD